MTPAEKCDALQREFGYWEAETSWNTSLGVVKGFYRHIDYDKLQAIIADLLNGRPKAVVSDLVYWPPVENHILEFEQMARCLDDEEFLTTGRFRNGLTA